MQRQPGTPLKSGGPWWVLIQCKTGASSALPLSLPSPVSCPPPLCPLSGWRQASMASVRAACLLAGDEKGTSECRLIVVCGLNLATWSVAAL